MRSLKNNQTLPGGEVGSQEWLLPSRLHACPPPTASCIRRRSLGSLGAEARAGENAEGNILQRVWLGSGRAASTLQGYSTQVGLWIPFCVGSCLGLDYPWGCVLRRAQGSVRLAGGGGGRTLTPRPGPRAVLAPQLSTSGKSSKTTQRTRILVPTISHSPFHSFSHLLSTV